MEADDTAGWFGKWMRRYQFRSKRPGYKFVLMFLDWVGIMGALPLVWFAYETPHVPFPWYTPEPFLGQLLVALGFSALALFIYHSHRLYKINMVLSLPQHLIGLLRANLYAVLCHSVLLVLIARVPVVRENILAAATFFLVNFSASMILRLLLFRTLFRVATRGGLYSRSVLILGTGKLARKMAHTLIEDRAYGLRVTGFLDDTRAEGLEVVPGVRVLGTLHDVGKVVRRMGVHEVIICLEDASEEELLALFDRCTATSALVTVASPVYHVIPMRLFRESYGDIPVIGVNNFGNHAYGGMLQLKRLGDIVFALLGLILQAPFILLVALAIKLDSPGPVLFTQVRIGKRGKPFKFYKFRSMTVGDDSAVREEEYARLINGTFEPLVGDTPTKIVDTARVTRVGRLLRSTSVDELPQLFNVLKGDMSLVGPRPCLPYEWKHYDEWHKRRLDVTPGCTGVWQVLGRSQVNFREMVILDLYYGQNLSFRLDLWLFLKTIPVMLFARGGK